MLHHTIRFIVASTILLTTAHAFDLGRPDAHAPISVMGDHTHHAGEVMLSYRYMFMSMQGMQSGTDGQSSAEVFARGFAVTPENMQMSMHMFGAMYAPTEKLTLMVMLPYRHLKMEHAVNPAAPAGFTAGGGRGFTTETHGIGDIKATLLYQLYDEGGKRWHAGLGFSFPTGSIGERDRTPGIGGYANRQLPASMQLGSGTFDLLPSLTYVSQESANWSWGAQASGVIRTHENHHDYRLGHIGRLQAWTGYRITDWVSPSLRIGYQYEEALQGTQSDLTFNPPFGGRSVTTAFGENYGGHRIDGGIGVNLFVPEGPLKGNRLAIEVSRPLYQDLNGIQLETDYTVTAGWQFAF